MTISAPVFHIYCDEPGCGNSTTLLLIPTITGFYEIGCDIEGRYAHWGGETLADGKHRCSTCKTRMTADGVPEPADA